MSQETNAGNSPNIIKCRDDHEPILFHKAGDNKFALCEGSTCSWLKKEEFGPEDLRPRIEPWLSALFQSEHLALLAGSGLMHAIHKVATGNHLLNMSAASFAVFNEEIGNAAHETAMRIGRDKANFEDHIRIANELLTGLEHYCPQSASFYGSQKLKAKIRLLKEEVTRNLNEFAASILIAEKNLAMTPEQKREEAFGYLVNFLMSFASRSGTRDRLHIFTTNYDRLIEIGAELAGVHMLDRFLGNISPIFRSSRLNIDMHYNPPGIRGEPRYLEGVAHFTKLHGSIDWLNSGQEIRRFGLPFGAESLEPYLCAPGLVGLTPRNLMIYPNSSKDRETAAYPYVELFRDFAAAVCRPNSTLVTFGYSFGDDHINRIIEDMLTIPSTHLVIISFDDSLGRIMRTYDRVARHDQISLLVGNHLGDIQTLVDHYLPKSAIDRTTYRMAELLKARFGTQQTDPSNNDDREKGDGK